MAAGRAVAPPRFVVQCAKGKGWKTLVVDESQPAAERAFREVVKVKPRGFFRLIRLDDNPEAEINGQDFSWKLLQLHDPRGPNHRPTQGRSPNPTAAGKPGERVGVPVKLYLIALVLGAFGAVVLYLLYGPRL